MTPDPNREWYVYFKEQEMGPLSEADLQSKVTGGELDSSAFVFTEGMADWTALDEVDFLSPEPLPPQGVVETLNPEPVTQSVVSGSRIEIEKVGTATEATETSQLEAASPLEQKLDADLSSRRAARRPKLLRWMLAGFVMLFLVGVLLDYADMIPKLKAPSSGDSIPLAGQDSATDTAPGAKPAPNDVDVMWAELASLRMSRDRQGAPFRISSILLSPERPVIVGSVSALIEASQIHLVVYPELSRTLLERPRVWWFDLPLVDGYFAAGPLNVDGAALPPGTYKVMAQGAGKYLGTVSFEVGSFPSGPDLEVRLKGTQNQRAMASADELKVLEGLFRDFDGLFEKLRADAVRLAIRGASRRTAWKAAMKPWSDAFSKTFRQLSDQQALTYYPELRSRLDSFSKELVKVQGLMDFYNANGRAGFERRAGMRYTEIWNSLQKDRDFLKSEFLSQASQTRIEPSLNEEQLKARLVERR